MQTGIRILVVTFLSLGLSSFTALGHESDGEHSHTEQTSTNSHRENVQSMLELMSIPEQVDQAARDFIRLYAVRDSLVGTNDAYQNILDVYHDSVEQLVTGILGWESLKTTYIDSYARQLSPEEVTSITSFLISDEGQRFMAAQKQVAADIQSVTAHLAEADLTPALTELRMALEQGMRQIHAQQKADQTDNSE